MTVFKIYLGGVQGVGKTTLAKIIAKDYAGMRHFSTSEILMDYFQVKNRKSLENIKISQELRNEIFANFYPRYCSIILDGHFKLAEIDKTFFNLFFFVDASNEIILSRRKQDKTRPRALELLCIEQEKGKELNLAYDFGINPVHIINEGNIAEAVTKIKNFINQLT